MIMPEKQLKVTLIAHTPDPEKTCALAARTCYSALDCGGLRELVEEKDQTAFLKRIVASGHLSVLEHASFTFFVEGVGNLKARWPRCSAGTGNGRKSWAAAARAATRTPGSCSPTPARPISP